MNVVRFNKIFYWTMNFSTGNTLFNRACFMHKCVFIYISFVLGIFLCLKNMKLGFCPFNSYIRSSCQEHTHGNFLSLTNTRFIISIMTIRWKLWLQISCSLCQNRSYILKVCGAKGLFIWNLVKRQCPDPLLSRIPQSFKNRNFPLIENQIGI